MIAIVGRPNVGKSTLFNRLVGQQHAVVADIPGTTRDRLVAKAEWNGITFDIVDTGGIEPLPRCLETIQPLGIDSASFLAEIRAQAEMAIAEADAVIFMTEITSGVTAADYEVAAILRRFQRRLPGLSNSSLQPPVLLAVNKSDTAARREAAVEFYELGMGDPYPISAIHGEGVADLLDHLVAVLPRQSTTEDTDANAVKIAIVGRPNVGKSSLLNRLVGEERAIVSPIPGTTRDALDTHLDYHGQPITLIDTAGLRRRGHIDAGVEKWSALRALKAIARADVALVVVDATEPFTAQDAHVAGFVVDELKSVVVLVNKWDAVPQAEHPREEYTSRLRASLRFLDYVPILFVSAQTGAGCGQILPTALQVNTERHRRIPTAELNRLVRQAITHSPPHPRGGRQLKIGYAAQVHTDPPTFLFHVNNPELVHFSYERYLENCLRQAYGFLGTPLRLSFRKKSRR